jgi:hypothetical protein
VAGRVAPFAGLAGLSALTFFAAGPKSGAALTAATVTSIAIVDVTNRNIDSTYSIRNYFAGASKYLKCTRTAGSWVTPSMDERLINDSDVPVIKKKTRIVTWNCQDCDGKAFTLSVCEDIVVDLMTRYRSSVELKQHGYQVASRMRRINIHGGVAHKVIEDSYHLAYLWRCSREQAVSTQIGSWLN